MELDDKKKRLGLGLKQIPYPFQTTALLWTGPSVFLNYTFDKSTEEMNASW